MRIKLLSTLFCKKNDATVKKPEFLKNVHIGKIIRTEMEKRHLTKEMIAERMKLQVWVIRDTFKQKSIKINRLIAFSYAIGVDFLQVYLKEMRSFANTKHFADEVIVKVVNGQLSVTPSKRSRTADFTNHIHIGKISKEEAKRLKMLDLLPRLLNTSQSAINRMFNNPDIDTARLVWLSYLLNCDFIRNVYLPCMAVNENEMIANDSISDSFTIKINPKTVSVITESQTRIYHSI